MVLVSREVLLGLIVPGSKRPQPRARVGHFKRAIRRCLESLVVLLGELGEKS